MFIIAARLWMQDMRSVPRSKNGSCSQSVACHGAQDGGLLIGAAVTQEELIDCLLGGSSAKSSTSTDSSQGAAARRAPSSCPNGQPQLPSCRNGQPERPQRSSSGSGGSVSNALKWLLGMQDGGSGAKPGADPAAVWVPMAKHLQRIAGNQVRA